MQIPEPVWTLRKHTFTCHHERCFDLPNRGAIRNVTLRPKDTDILFEAWFWQGTEAYWYRGPANHHAWHTPQFLAESPTPQLLIKTSERRNVTLLLEYEENLNAPASAPYIRPAQMKKWDMYSQHFDIPAGESKDLTLCKRAMISNFVVMSVPRQGVPVRKFYANLFVTNMKDNGVWSRAERMEFRVDEALQAWFPSAESELCLLIEPSDTPLSVEVSWAVRRP